MQDHFVPETTSFPCEVVRFAFLPAASIVRNFCLFTRSKKLNFEPTLNRLMNSFFSDCPRIFAPNTSISTSILTADPEAREYNLFLTATLQGFTKLWIAETTFKTAVGAVLDI